MLRGKCGGRMTEINIKVCGIQSDCRTDSTGPRTLTTAIPSFLSGNKYAPLLLEEETALLLTVLVSLVLIREHEALLPCTKYHHGWLHRSAPPRTRGRQRQEDDSSEAI